jgi:protein involved in polysaccharide export with SLBB domain
MVSSATKAVPANRLPKDLFDCPRESLAPLPFAALGQTRPADHLIGAGDTLSVYVFGVFPPTEEETPVIQRQQALNQNYYPARGSQVGPGLGLPVQVEADGTIALPLIDKMNLTGLTMGQAREKILAAYKEEDILQDGRERISISLLVPRLTRVVVLREDTPRKRRSH